MLRPSILLALLAACAAAEDPIDDAAGDDGKADGIGTAGGSYIRYDKFNGLTTGSTPSGRWTSEATGGATVAVREVPFHADKSIELVKPAVKGTASLATTFRGQTGRVAFEAKVMTRETAGFKAIPYVYGSGDSAVASIAFREGNIEAHVGATRTVMQPFVANVWYRVRVVVDTDRDVFDLFIDGVRKGHDLALRAPASGLQKVRYYMDGSAAGTLLVDNVRVYNEAAYIGEPPEPVFDPRTFGAIGDGAANDHDALQAAIDAATGSGGSVVLADGTFLTSSLTLKSDMTLFVASSAVLLGSPNPADYPTLAPATGNTQLHNTQRALLYAEHATNVRIDGGGTIDGSGDAFKDLKAEADRPVLVWAVLSDVVSVQNVFLKKGAVWSLVMMETDDVLINNVNVQSDGITHDGIDIVDGSNIWIQNVAVHSGDDAMCLKSGVRRGIDTLTVRDSTFSGSGSYGGSNGIKFGTATYGAFTNVHIEDNYVKDVQYAAMAVESRQGSEISNITFRRIGFDHVGSAFFVYLAQQDRTHPLGDTPKLGSIDGVSFIDIAGTTASWPNAKHLGSLITGHIFNGVTYPIRNLAFTNVAVTFVGGSTTVPTSPREATPDEYPEASMFGDLPAWGYYLRHVAGVTFTSCTSTLANPDVRSPIVSEDATGL